MLVFMWDYLCVCVFEGESRKQWVWWMQCVRDYISNVNNYSINNLITLTFCKVSLIGVFQGLIERVNVSLSVSVLEVVLGVFYKAV